MPRNPPQFVGTPLPNEKHEAFARCLARHNLPLVCYIGTGGRRDQAAAEALADQKEIRRRAEEVYRQFHPFNYVENGYEHILEKLARWKKESKRKLKDAGT